MLSNFGMRLFRHAKHRHDQEGPMSIVMAVVLPTLLFAVTDTIDVRGEVLPPPMSG